MIDMYENSPKVKCKEGMCGAFQWKAELQIPSQDRVSISSGARKPRSCVDFAEIVCRFRQVIDWGTLEIGSDLKNLHRGGELWERGDRGDRGDGRR